MIKNRVIQNKNRNARGHHTYWWLQGEKKLVKEHPELMRWVFTIDLTNENL